MGGIGSGPNGRSRKTTVEECKTLDVNEFNREGYLRAGMDTGSSKWYRNGEVTASIGWEAEEEGLRLFYTVTRPDGEKKEYDYLCRIEWTPCNFGGERSWFLCPSCWERVTKLHMPPGGDRFLCRECWNLTYESCQARRKFLEETGLKIQRVKKKLGDPDSPCWDPVLEKPKGMHWKTYYKLSEEMMQLQDQLAGELRQATRQTFPNFG